MSINPFKESRSTINQWHCQKCGALRSECPGHNHFIPQKHSFEEYVWRKYGGDLGTNISENELKHLVDFELGIFDDN